MFAYKQAGASLEEAAENGFNAYQWADWRGKKDTARLLARAMGADSDADMQDSSHSTGSFSFQP